MAANYASWHSVGGALAAAYARSLMTQQVETVVQLEGNGPVYGLLVPGMPSADYVPTAEVRALPRAA